ncbi:hypothetical protein LUZ60_008149 [Juncus effusus]|nr:hypothetical protein LUZ60_008149 [Juncus effusus]
MAVQIGYYSSFSSVCSTSCNNSKLAISSLRCASSQRNIISQLGNIRGHIQKDRHAGFRYSCRGGLNFNNSKRGFHIKKLLVSFTTTEEINPNTNPNSPTPQQDSPFNESNRPQGKPGFVSFHGPPNYKRSQKDDGYSSTSEPEKAPDLAWFVGPTVLVSFLVLPSVYMRKVLSLVLEDSLLTDFLILFFTEALFYMGVLIFILLTDHTWKIKIHSQNKSPSPNPAFLQKEPRYFRILSVATKVLNLIIPLVTMGLVWPWTGPAASATLAPYLVGLVVQFAFEQYARKMKSPSWLVVPVIFQVYRLHQLNRAAQLVTALTFSVRSAELTSQTLAITNSLGALLIILQILGVICIWSLSSFLMRFLPSSPNSSET